MWEHAFSRNRVEEPHALQLAMPNRPKPRKRKRGDWTCPDPQCNATVFATKDKCYKCGAARPTNGGGTAATSDSAGGSVTPDAADAPAATEELITKKLCSTPSDTISGCYDVSYAPDAMGKPLEDHYVYRHQNSICVIGLAPTHPAVADPNIEVRAVSFKSSRGADLLAHRVKGKKKKGGAELSPTSFLCTLECIRRSNGKMGDNKLRNAGLGAVAGKGVETGMDTGAEVDKTAVAGVIAGTETGTSVVTGKGAVAGTSVRVETDANTRVGACDGAGADAGVQTSSGAEAARSAQFSTGCTAAGDVAESGDGDGEPCRFIVRACIYGYLLESNEALAHDPSLIVDKASTSGYVAIIQPRYGMTTLKGLRNSAAERTANRITQDGILLDKAAYHELCYKRKCNNDSSS